jgi:hypothetical protein
MRLILRIIRHEEFPASGITGQSPFTNQFHEDSHIYAPFIQIIFV